jgi:uncharacterized protein (TIGR02001 family)
MKHVSLRRLTTHVLLGIVVFFGATAKGEEGGFAFGTISGSVAGLTDYVARGVSLTRGNPALQLSIEWSRPVIDDLSIYVGTFMSKFRIPDIDSKEDLPFHLEQDVEFGVRYKVSEPILVDVGYILYRYPLHKRKPNLTVPDWNEIFVKLDYDFVVAKLHGQWYRSIDFSFHSGVSDYISLSADIPVGWQDLMLNAHAGYFRVENHVPLGLPDYADFSIGVSRDFPELGGINISLNGYITTIGRNSVLTGKGGRTIVDDRVYRTTQPHIVLGITKSF